MTLLRVAFSIFGGLLVFATALPLVPTNDWWIRIWDFPRIQVAVLIGLVLIAMPLVLNRRLLRTWALVFGLLVAITYQLMSIWPYTPLHTSEVKEQGSCGGSEIRLVTANVLMTNRNAEPLLEQVRRLDPDLVLLVETDDWWDERLGSLKARYAHVVSQPRDDTYGLHFFSRFEVVDSRVRFLIDDYVPSLRAGLRLPSGVLIEFHGVHSKPPPHQDTARRDAELLLAAMEVRQTREPSILAGDLNDVAWSRTTQLFRRVGGLVDPRIGRGSYPTFNANWPLLRWPLDHVFFEPEFALVDLRVLGHVGSDHFPVYASLCYAPETASARRPPRLLPNDLTEAHKAIREGREEALEKP